MVREKRPLSAITCIVLHHAGSADKWSTHETLHQHLLATNLGYHATVDDDEVFKSKAAGHDGKWTWKVQAPLTEVVWGAAGCNYHGAHISVDGNSGVTGVTEDEKTCVVQITVAWCKQFGWKKKDVLGDKNGVGSRLITHNYVGLHISPKRYVTECPGKPLIDWMPEYRARVAAYLPD